MRPPLAALLTLPILIVTLLAFQFGEASDTWRGLVVAAEHRCSPYDRDDYYYPQSLEDRIIAALGGIYSPYTGEKFASKRETDIEHMVAVSEAHDSGLCAVNDATKRRFASDLLNLTLAAPDLNRYVKRAHDAADWLPELNRCWFAARIVEVRRKYDLTIDRREADALEAVLSRCSSTELVIDLSMPQLEEEPTSSATDPLELWDSNGNGRITCAEAREHGIAPVPRDHPAYRFMRDADGDGVVCE
ncbi:MAG: excalibur calcium-binding domain-containing protein [Truepera sp.]|nr:excalibur calcium-binding domain-containing protein [Truepera sp.]